MGIFKKENSRSLVITAVLLILAGTLAYMAYVNQDKLGRAFAGTSQPKEPAVVSCGVVDYEKLIPEHPDYAQLKKLDDEINMMGEAFLDPTRLKKLHDDLSKKMEQYKKKVEEILKSERDSIQAESQSRAKALHDSLGGEFARKQQDFNRFREQLEKEYAKKNDDPNRPLTKWELEFAKRVRKHSGDLVALKERQIAAKELELQKKSQVRLMEVKNRLNKELADFEDALRQEHQNEKLNLQLKLQVAKDDQEREEIQKQLQTLYDDENSRTDAKRKELGEEFKKYDDEEKAKNDSAIKGYRAKLDSDVNSQLQSTHRKVAEELYREGLKSGDKNPMVPDEIKAKLESRRAQLIKDMKALEDSLKPRMKEIEQQAEARFESRKKEMIGKLQEYQKQLEGEFERKKREILGEMETVSTEKFKARERLIRQRENLYNRIVEDINQKVKLIAEEEKVDYVVGDYLVNVEGKDLNDKALEAVRKSGGTEKK